MRKLILTLCAVFCASTGAFALNLTDPFYMPEQGVFVSDTKAGFSNNDLRKGRSLGLYEEVTYGIADNISLGFALGYAHIHTLGTGITDPSVNFTYRFFDAATDDFFFDLKAYVSPELFDSPYNNKGGAAKGSNDFGIKSLVGNNSLIDGVTLGASAKLDFIGSTDETSSGQILGLDAFAKVYLTDADSVQAGLKLYRYMGFEPGFTGYGFNVNYAREIVADKLAVIPYLDIESHNKNIATSVNYGVAARYKF